MREIFRIIGVLTLVCLVCAFCLSFVDSLARDKIELNQRQAIDQGIRRLAPWAEEIKPQDLDGQPSYQLLDNKARLKGYAFLAEGQGYQDKIKILAVVDVSLEHLQGIEIIESTETPGLGGRIQEESFRRQFIKLKALPQIEYTKDEAQDKNQIKAITGATISSRAVVNILNKRIKQLREQLGSD